MKLRIPDYAIFYHDGEAKNPKIDICAFPHLKMLGLWKTFCRKSGESAEKSGFKLKHPQVFHNLSILMPQRVEKHKFFPFPLFAVFCRVFAILFLFWHLRFLPRFLTLFVS